jgi:branched-chain amino acid transport system substrate-binding protein
LRSNLLSPLTEKPWITERRFNEFETASLTLCSSFLYPEDASRLLQQATELGISLPILATATFEDPKLLKVCGAHSIVFASPVPPDNSQPARAQFLAAYKTQYGEDAGVLSDTGYDAAMILIKAYANVGKQGPDAIAGYIKSLKQYPGISGAMTFDAAGDVRKPYRLRTVRNNRFDWL